MATRDSVRRFLTVRQLPVIAIAIYGIALVAWIAILRQWLPSPEGEMGTQMSDPGVPEAMVTGHGLGGVGFYLAMWGVMMIAMMYPSSVPLFRLYYGTLQDATRVAKITRLGALLGTYTLVWTLTGLIPLTVNSVIPIAALATDHGPLLFGAVLILLGGYQLSPYKHRCLNKCRSPLGFLLSYHRPGIRGAVSMGWRFSLFCVGCCWALFAFVVVAGTMNILWMGVITIVLSLERTVSWGPRLATAVGVLSASGGGSLIVMHVMVG